MFSYLVIDHAFSKQLFTLVKTVNSYCHDFRLPRPYISSFFSMSKVLICVKSCIAMQGSEYVYVRQNGWVMYDQKQHVWMIYEHKLCLHRKRFLFQTKQILCYLIFQVNCASFTANRDKLSLKIIVTWKINFEFSCR